MKKLSFLIALLFICCSVAACNDAQSPIDATPDQIITSFESSDSNEIAEESNSAESTPEEVGEIKNPSPEIADDGYLNIRVNDYFGGFNEEGCQGIYLIKDHNQLLECYKETGFAITDKYESDFFEDNNLVLILVERGSGGYIVDIKHARIKNSILQVTITDRIGADHTDDMQYKIFAVEIAKADMEGIEKAELITESTVYSYPNDNINLKSENFELYKYTGTIDKGNESFMVENCGWLEIITDDYELDQFLNRYTTCGDDTNDVYTFAQEITENFFEEKSILAIPCYEDIKGNYAFYPNSYYELKDIVLENDIMTLNLQESTNNITSDGVQLAVIDKDILPKDNKYIVLCNFILWE